MPLDEQVAQLIRNGDLIGETAPAEPLGQEETFPAGPQREPLPAEVLGGKIALLVGALAATLPAELAPQSRYQIAVDLTKTVIGSQLAQTLAP
jgi:hypothetical protein